MNIKTFYDSIGGDYHDALRRFMNDTLVQKFVTRFLDDRSYEQLCQGFQDKDHELAFRAAHNLKGVSANLSFAKLYQSSSELTELLRSSECELKPELLRNVEIEYRKVIEELKKLMSVY